MALGGLPFFTEDQARRAAYFIESGWYCGWPFAGTAGATSLATGTTRLVNANNWNVAGAPTWRATITGIATTRDTAGNTTLTYQADQTDQANGFGQASGNTLAARVNMEAERVDIGGVYQLTAQLVNANTAAEADWQTNIRITMQRLTAMDKLIAQRDGLQGGPDGWYQFSPQEIASLGRLGITDAAGNVTESGLDQMKAYLAAGLGQGPKSIPRLLDILFGGGIMQDAPEWFYPNVSDTEAQFAYWTSSLSSATRGRFPVLVGLRFPGSSNVQVVVDSDSRLNYFGNLTGAAFTQNSGDDWDFWVPNMRQLRLHTILGVGGAAGSMPIGVRVAQASMTETLAVLCGRVADRSELSDPFTFDRAIVGAFV